MVLWILLISMVLFAATFIGLVKKPKLRYPISIFFLLLAGACSISLMLNDSHHLGMKSITETQTKTLVSTTGKNSPLKLTVYKALGNGKEKVFVYRTADQPNKNQKTKIDYDVTTKVEHSNVQTPQVVIQRSRYTYQNDFWKTMFAGLGLNKETHHYTYIFKVPQNWLVLSTSQLQAMKSQEAAAKAQIKDQVKAQLPNLVKAQMMKELQKNPTMNDQQKAQLEKQITAQQEKQLVAKLEQQMMGKLMPQLEKESL